MTVGGVENPGVCANEKQTGAMALKVKFKTNRFCTLILGATVTALAAMPVNSAAANDLLQHYPTTLTGGLMRPDQARAWEFTASDVFHISRFHFEVGGQLTVDTGPA